MKPETINHEVLLFTGSQFSKRQYVEMNNGQPRDFANTPLERACWNGLVFEILPEIFECSSERNTHFIWNVIPAENFIEMRMGAAPFDPEYFSSISPYLFLLQKNWN